MSINNEYIQNMIWLDCTLYIVQKNTHKDKTLYGGKAVHSDICESWIPEFWVYFRKFYFRLSLLPGEDDVPDNARRCGK
jgi:hypothetical protein